MQYPEPDDGAWPARVLRNRRMNQVPETENPATPLRFMHQRHATLIEVRLETGFRHPIRATMAHLGHPVLGDAEYGGTGDAMPVEAPRQLLHAAGLSVDGIAVEISLPEDFEIVLTALGAEEEHP